MSTTIVQSLLQAAALYNSCNWMIYWTSLIQLTFVMSPNVIYNFLSSINEKGSRFLYMYVIIIKIKGKFNQFWGFFFSYSLVGLNLHSPPPPKQKKTEKRKHQVTTTVIHYSKISMKKKILNLIIFLVSVYVDFIIVSSSTQLLFYQSAINCTILFSHDN